jgi:integrase
LSHEVEAGHDPAAERKSKARAERISQVVKANENSFRAVATDWFDRMSTSWTSAKHVDDVKRRLELNIYPQLGDRPIAEIDAPEVLAAIRKIEDRGATDLSHRVLAVAGQVFRYGIATGKCKYDISASLRGALTPHNRLNQAAVTVKELPKLMQNIDKYNELGDRKTQLALKVIAHTFVRTSELIESTWDEFDFEAKLWVIPGWRMKGKLDHVIPLTRIVLTYLKELKILAGNSKYVIPGRNPLKPISNNTILFALYRMGYKQKMTGHGFRAVASTVLNENEFNEDWIERQLAHVEANKVRGAYNRAQYIKGRTEMMNWWSQYLLAIEQGKPAPVYDNVL